MPEGEEGNCYSLSTGSRPGPRMKPLIMCSSSWLSEMDMVILNGNLGFGEEEPAR